MTEEDKNKIVKYSNLTRLSLIQSFINSKTSKQEFDWVIGMFYIKQYKRQYQKPTND
jgi:hypothetical protein